METTQTQRKQFRSELKAKVALAAIKGDRTAGNGGIPSVADGHSFDNSGDTPLNSCVLKSSMARIARIVAPHIPHHVTQRGNRRQNTFFCDDDYQLYLDLLAQWCQHFEVEIWAYCLRLSVRSKDSIGFFPQRNAIKDAPRSAQSRLRRKCR